MNELGRMKTVSDKVKHLITKDERLKDSDELLTVNLWWWEVREAGLDPKTCTLEQFLLLYQKRKITEGETVTRARRQLQKAIPELRGKLYEQRQNESKIVRQEISR